MKFFSLLRQKFSLILVIAGPGLYLIGYNIGPGSVTTMTQSGAKFGMSLAWALVFSCIFTYVMIVAYGRYTLITGKTALYSFRVHFHWIFAAFVFLGILSGELSSSIGVMGIVAEAVHEWSTFALPASLAISPTIAAFVFCTVLYILYLAGQYQSFEKILAVLVGIMGLSFLLSLVLLNPHPMDMIRGLYPAMPRGDDAPLIAAGMAGTTLSPVIFIVRSITMKERNWGPGDLKLEKRDALISVITMFILSVSIMSCAAGTLFLRGLSVNTAIDMVQTLEPLAGEFAASLFVLGIIAAGLSSFFPIMILAPWLINDIRNKPLNMHTPVFKIVVLLACSLGLISPVFGGKPVIIIIASQAFQGLSMPLVALFIILLLNNSKIVGDRKLSIPMNIACWATFLFSLIMAYFGVEGLIGLF